VYTEQEFDGTTQSDNLMKAIQEKIKEVVSRSAGIIRTFNGLLMGKLEMEELSRDVNSVFEKSRPTWLLSETRNLLTVAQLIIEQSLHQHENKGTFYNQDLVGKAFPVKAKSPMI
jgi:L-aspartate oxidase